MKSNLSEHIIGNRIEIDGVNLNIYIEGKGDKTLIFLPGFGMCSPIFSFKSLASLLASKYKVVIIEKAGYGFSDISTQPKDLDSVITQLRKLLEQSRLPKPYILCPCSIAGLDALYWAHKYPQDIDSIIGIDMTFPRLMQEYKYSMGFLRLAALVMRSGIACLFPKMAQDETYLNGNLNDQEKAVYKELFFCKTLSKDILNEATCLKQNIEMVAKLPVPKVPMLLFISNGLDTGIDQEKYLQIYDQVIGDLDNPQIIRLDCSHFVHLFGRDIIAAEILKRY